MKHAGIRIPAEWEPVEAVMVAWPHDGTDWSYMLGQVRQCYKTIIEELSHCVDVIVIGPHAPETTKDTDRRRVHYVPVPTNDTWTRDYGPLCTIDEQGSVTLNDFGFNAWGLKFAADLDNLANRRIAAADVFAAPLRQRGNYVLEGGSIESDGCGTILTTSSCLLSPNRNGGLTKGQTQARLRRYLGARRVLWLDKGSLSGDDTDGHVDTLARLLPPGDTIAYACCGDAMHPDFVALSDMESELRQLRRSNGEPYRLMPLPLPEPIYDPDDGTLLPSTYANFLIVNSTVLVPTYGQESADSRAMAALTQAMPGYDIRGIDCRALIRQHGSLHCATMQLHSGSTSILPE